MKSASLAVRRIAWAWIGYAAVGLAVALAAVMLGTLYPLVLLCRAEIERDRVGQGENRYAMTMQEYAQWLERVMWNTQKSAGNKPRYMKR